MILLYFYVFVDILRKYIWSIIGLDRKALGFTTAHRYDQFGREVDILLWIDVLWVKLKKAFFI